MKVFCFMLNCELTEITKLVKLVSESFRVFISLSNAILLSIVFSAFGVDKLNYIKNDFV